MKLLYRFKKISFLVVIALAAWSCESYFCKQLLRIRLNAAFGRRSGWDARPVAGLGSSLGSLPLIHFGQSDLVQLLHRQPGNNYSVVYYDRGFGGKAPTDMEVAWCFKFLYRTITAENAALKLLNDAEAE